MITQALSYRPVDQATLSQPRTGKGGLRPVDFLRLIDARPIWSPAYPTTPNSGLSPSGSVVKGPQKNPTLRPGPARSGLGWKFAFADG